MDSIIVTGAGSGLGKELAHQLSKKGYHLILTGRSVDKLNTVQKEIGNAEVVSIDIRNPIDINRKIAELGAKYHLNGLINNAGVGYFGPFPELNDRQIVEMIETNVFGTIHMTKAVLPFLLRTGGGRLINIISTAGLRGKLNESVYAASKFAIRGFTESLQKEYENSGLTITAVYMGGMDTPFWAGNNHISDPSRLRSPREIAEIIMEQLDQSEIIIESKKS